MPKFQAADLRGVQFGRLVVLRLGEPNGHGRLRWWCRCACGAETLKVADDLRKGSTKSCGCLRREVGAARLRGLRQDVVEYEGAHTRVKRLRGKANEHQCRDCDAKAMDWSYNYGDPDELTDKKGRPYSMNPEYYSPRCRRCHAALDRQRRSGADGAVVVPSR